jgi:hypothetical protein
VQNGLGIYVQAKGPNAITVDTVNAQVSGFQKNGITYNGCGCAGAPDGTVTGTISGSTITGAGDVPVIAQNGIQIGFGAGPVTVTGNTVSGHRYTGDPNAGTGSGLLVFSSGGNAITANEIADNNNGIAIEGGSFGLCAPGDSTGNVVSCNRIHDQDVLTWDVGLSIDAAANTVQDNAFAANATGLDATAITSGSLDARYNWWGCATGPGTPGCDTALGAATTTPFRAAVPPCIDCTADADCDDGLVCDGVESCNVGSGACVAGTPPTCTLGSADPQCNAAVCQEPGGCAVVPSANGTLCTGPAGDACSVADGCQAGACVDGGGGDPDADGICSADDNCPTNANPGQSNVDGEDGGDVCDPQEGTITLNKLRLKADSSGVGDSSSMGVKGEFVTQFPGDVFSAAAPIVLTVAESLGTTRTITFPPSGCKTSATVISCRTSDGLAKAVFKSRPTAPGLWRMSAKAKKQALASPFQGPATVRLTYDGSLDRVGTITDCVSTFAVFSCRQY